MKIHTVVKVRNIDFGGSQVSFHGNFENREDAVKRVKEILAKKLEQYASYRNGTWTKEHVIEYYADEFSGIVDNNGDYPIPHQYDDYGDVKEYLRILDTELNAKVEIEIS